MKARRILDVIADILILLVLFIAAVGHFLPWIERYEIRGYEAPHHNTANWDHDRDDPLDDSIADDLAMARDERPSVIDFQMWHAARSGAALAVTALLVGISLTMNLGIGARKLLALVMFVSVLVAVSFQVMIFTPYALTEAHRQFAEANWRDLEGYYVAIVPSVIAGALCLVRMGWTMPVSAGAKPPRVDREPLRNL